MKDQGHQAMWPQMSAALAAIDEALGLPADGCNSTAQTLAAIKKLKDGRDAFQESLYAELDTNFRLRDLGGAQPDEPMTPFIERVIAERDRFRAALLDCARQAERPWNPLTNNEDALVLAVRIGLQVTAYPMYDEPKHSVIVRKPVWDHDAQEGDGVEVIEPYGTDALAATRRAITMCAAELARRKTPNVGIEAGA